MTFSGASLPRLVNWAPSPSAPDIRAVALAPSLPDVSLDLSAISAVGRRMRRRSEALALNVQLQASGSSEINLGRGDGFTNQQGGTWQ
jgi:hypothetical protein